MVDGKAVKIAETDGGRYHAVHNDTMPALRHPVTGKMYDSKSEYIKECNRLGLEIIGNELLSEKGSKVHNLKDPLTDEVIIDKIHKAESIFDDPTKLRARQNENLERLERWRNLVHEPRG